MKEYNIIGIDLAKHLFHLVALDASRRVVMKKAIKRDAFFMTFIRDFAPNQTFAMEACGGFHYVAQCLMETGHNVIVLKAKDVKPYAKSRQKNDANDALAICKAALDPELKQVGVKTKAQQESALLHKARRHTLCQRIATSNGILTSLQEFGVVFTLSKARFAKECRPLVTEAYEKGRISKTVYEILRHECGTIEDLLKREKELDRLIEEENKHSPLAQCLKTIPGIGPLNASVLAHKSFASYDSAKDFAASLGLVPRQITTGGTIRLGSITKQGDRYARTLLIQAGRALVMRACKDNPPKNALYDMVKRLQKKGKPFNVVCTAMANKIARIAYGCAIKMTAFQGEVSC